MTRVLVALDESDESVAAARVALGLFGPDAEYVGINVADSPARTLAGAGWGDVFAYSPYTWPAVDEQLVDQLEDEAEQEATAQAAEAGLDDAQILAEVGDPATAILRAAEERAVDVIVVGSTGRGWWDRLIHGSVSESVVRGTALPVLVVG